MASTWPSTSRRPRPWSDNIERIAPLGVDLVVGTTGWHERMDYVKSLVDLHKIGLVWSPNYSVGVNAFFRIVSAASKLLSNEPEYEAWAWEIHHSAKKDAPSGTLLKVVDEMRAAGFTRNVDTASNRAGAIPGVHEIGFDSVADTITLRHTRAQSGRLRAGCDQGGRVGRGQEGFLRIRRCPFWRLTCLRDAARRW